VAARVVLPPSGTTLLFVAPRNAVAARLTCRKRFRPIYSCSRIRMDYSPASLRPGEPSVNRVHSPRRGDHSFGTQMAEIMRLVATDVTSGVITNSGHWVMEEQPRQTTAAIVDFIDKK
jgi:pimeloyl-ACP methyl ester carboxylesterase